MAEFISEIESLQVERDEALARADKAEQLLSFERAQERQRLRQIRAALEAEMAEGKGRARRLINPVGSGRVFAWLEAEERSLRWLSRQVGVTHVHLLHVLRGDREPSVDLIERIAAVTGVDLDDLMPAGAAVAS